MASVLPPSPQSLQAPAPPSATPARALQRQRPRLAKPVRPVPPPPEDISTAMLRLEDIAVCFERQADIALVFNPFLDTDLNGLVGLDEWLGAFRGFHVSSLDEACARASACAKTP